MSVTRNCIWNNMYIQFLFNSHEYGWFKCLSFLLLLWQGLCHPQLAVLLVLHVNSGRRLFLWWGGVPTKLLTYKHRWKQWKQVKTNKYFPKLYVARKQYWHFISDIAVTTVFKQLICIWCKKMNFSHTIMMVNVLSWFITEFWAL